MSRQPFSQRDALRLHQQSRAIEDSLVGRCGISLARIAAGVFLGISVLGLLAGLWVWLLEVLQ